MPSIKTLFIILFLLLFVGKIENVSAQENNYLKQFINESFKTNLKSDLFNSEPLSDSLPEALDIMWKDSRLIDLDVNKKPLPRLSYNYHFNTILRQSIDDFQKFTNDSMETNENLFVPYTNPKYNPIRNKLMDYQYMIPEKIYNELSGKGLISINAIAEKINSKLNPKQEKSLRIRFSESEKNAIIERTNQFIWEIYYSDSFSTKEDSTYLEKKPQKDTIPLPIREFRNPPYY